MHPRIRPLSRAAYSTVGSLRARAQENIARIDNSSPISSALVDTFRRKHDYLRISLTERCNLRCFYCMPSEGVELSPNENILSNEEVLRLAGLFVKSGVTKIRLTGGEPTVRKGISEIFAGLNDLRAHGLKSIGMTSNGIALHRKLPEFVRNGLTHLNLSLDTLDEFRFEIMTRRRGFQAVLKALDTALEYLPYVKLNVVVVKGLNDSEVLDFVEMTKDRPIFVRFIEFMPFTGNKWDAEKMVPSAELLKRISERHPLIERASDELNDTARTWKIPGYVGNLGFISSMSDHFCATCNRLRITADGQIKVCLFDAKEVSLRDYMRSVVCFSMARQRRVQRQQLRFNSTSHAPRLSHLDGHGRASMVDVSPKTPTTRSATASGRISIPKVAYDLVTSTYPEVAPLNSDPVQAQAVAKARRKGDALTVAQIAAITGAKQTSNLIPLCHPLLLNNVSVVLSPEARTLESGVTEYSVVCRATVTCEGKTGVEMEALTAVSVGLLTVFDMLKAVAGREMVIGNIEVDKKTGGKHDFMRAE
uniref:Radical SAM core domain-containing protein n=1 Tax=Mycena chlorophos TaxID=658473 RepID=A0ABQ0M296_MYCCL|nr:predicted protein [Mycena chlorophos]